MNEEWFKYHQDKVCRQIYNVGYSKDRQCRDFPQENGMKNVNEESYAYILLDIYIEVSIDEMLWW